MSSQWHALERSEQAKYYEMARKEKELHLQLYPGWSARDNYGTHSKNKKKRKAPGSGTGSENDFSMTSGPGGGGGGHCKEGSNHSGLGGGGGATHPVGMTPTQHLAIYGGFPTSVEGMHIAREVFDARESGSEAP